MLNPKWAIPAAARRQMLQEVLRHQEAVYRETWAMPPLSPGDNAASYREMLLDPTVSYCVNLIQEAILAEPWHVEPAVGCPPSPPTMDGAGTTRALRSGAASIRCAQDRLRQAPGAPGAAWRHAPYTGRRHAPYGGLAMADEISRNLRDLDVESALQDALNAIWRGFWPHEIAWRYSGGTKTSFWLDSLASIDPDQVALELDDRMRVTAVLSRPDGREPQRVAKEKLWLHVHRPGRTRPAGESILEPAYRAWASKHRLLQFWGLSIQRFGMTHLRVMLPGNTTAARQASILETLRNGRLDGVYVLPEDVTVQEVNPTQWANLTFESAIDYQDAEIVKAIVLARSPGSVAAGQTYVTGAGLHEQARATSYRLHRISRALARSFTEQVIHPLCMANWGAHPADCPRLELPMPDPDRLIALAGPAAQLVSSGIASAETAAELLGLPATG